MKRGASSIVSSVNCGVLILFTLLFTLTSFHLEGIVLAQDDMILFIQKKQRELKEREESLAKNEERLKALRKDIDERIVKYESLLNQLETILKKMEHAQEEKIDYVVKAYEVMPPEEAATRLSELSEGTAVKIIRKMKPKKAGTIMAYMDSKKVASLTESMTTLEKIFPIR